MAFDKEVFLKNLETMSVMELMELIEAIEEKFGVSAAAPVAVANTHASEVEEIPSTVDVVLLNPGGSKIQVVKLSPFGLHRILFKHVVSLQLRLQLLVIL